jgi:hypothetical protein
LEEEGGKDNNTNIDPEGGLKIKIECPSERFMST